MGSTECVDLEEWMVGEELNESTERNDVGNDGGLGR